MPCYKPLQGYKSQIKSATGGYQITFVKSQGLAGGSFKMSVPCGQCIGCRLDRSREWAIRCVHEASLYEHNSFITLTYNEENLPTDNSLHKTHFQKFMKRLRKKYPNKKIRYYHCGEYGELNRRPHYHAIIFNLEFQDKKYFKEVNKQILYTSDILDEVWQHQGFTTIGNVTFESAAYVARYIMKKINGEQADEHYKDIKIDPRTGEILTIVQLQPEYTTMSRRPGIASDWYNKFSSDLFPSDEVILKGKKLKVPRFYQKIYQIEHPEHYEQLKLKRLKGLEKHKKDNTSERLAIRERCQQRKLDQLIRTLE